MSLLRPEWWPLLLLAPLAGLLLSALLRARARRLARAVGPRVESLVPASSRTRVTLYTLTLLLALLALLQPAWGEATHRVEQRGVDILVCLDVSQSMLARDIAPSRLDRARREIRALADRAALDRLGLVVFAGEAHLTAPLTRDRESFLDLVALAGPFSIERGGTDLGAALRLALEALEGATGDHEVALLLTDGEDHEGLGLRAARECARRGIAVHCVGFGSALGAKIPIGESYLVDGSGREVVSALDPATLRAIAEAAGGDFVDARENERSLVELYERRILPMARKTFLAEERRARENRYQWPLLAAFLLWILGLCVR